MSRSRIAAGVAVIGASIVAYLWTRKPPDEKPLPPPPEPDPEPPPWPDPDPDTEWVAVYCTWCAEVFEYERDYTIPEAEWADTTCPLCHQSAVLPWSTGNVREHEPPVPGTVTITRPLPGTEFELGSSIRVEWTFTGSVYGFLVDYYKPGDNQWRSFGDVRYIKGYSVTIPGEIFNVSGEYKIRVRPPTGEGETDETWITVPEPPSPPVSFFTCPGTHYHGCRYTTTSKEDLVAHIAANHLSFWDWQGNTPRYRLDRCSYCDWNRIGEGILVSRAYLDHIEEKHVLLCAECGEYLTYASAWFDRGLAWRDHMVSLHGMTVPSVTVVPLAYIETWYGDARTYESILEVLNTGQEQRGEELTGIWHHGSSEILIRDLNPTKYVMGEGHFIWRSEIGADDRCKMRYKFIIPELAGKNWSARLMSYDYGNQYYGWPPTLKDVSGSHVTGSGEVVKKEFWITIKGLNDVQTYIDLIVEYDNELLVVAGALVYRYFPDYTYYLYYPDHEERFANP